MIPKKSKLKICFLLSNRSNFRDSIMNDDRIPVINHLVDDLHKRLNDLERLYSTVIQFDFILFLFFILFDFYKGFTKFRYQRYDVKAIY